MSETLTPTPPTKDLSPSDRREISSLLTDYATLKAGGAAASLFGSGIILSQELSKYSAGQDSDLVRVVVGGGLALIGAYFAADAYGDLDGAEEVDNRRIEQHNSQNI